jgi:hypothetical protein
VSLRLQLVAFGCRAWLDSRPARRIAAAATGIGVVLAAVLPDAIANVGLLQAMTATLAVLVVVLALTVRWPRPGLTEIGLVLLVAASLWPRIAHLEPGVPGALLFILVTYGIGRLSGLSPRTLALVLLVAGAIMGAIAISEAVPKLSWLATFHPMHNGVLVKSTRPAGLFDNPNTFGGYEAMTVVLAAAVGLPLGWGKAWAAHVRSAVLLGAAALCLVGLGLSSSRESMLGILAGMAMLVVVPRKGFWERARSLLPYAIAAAVAVAVVLWVPTIGRSSGTGRFNPTTVSSDSTLMARVASWRLAVSLIRQAPLLGYGATIPMRSVDNVYLEWILGGGIVGLGIWLAAAVTVVPRAAWSLIVTLLVIGAFANPFAVGPELAILLISCGAIASQPPVTTTAATAEAAVDEPAGAYSATGKPRMLKPPST